MTRTILTDDGRVVEQAQHRGKDGGNTPMWVGRPQYRWDGSEWVDSYLSDGLVGMWDYQQHNISSGTLRDVSGNGNDMELTGASQTKGRIGQGIELNSTDSGEGRVPHSTELSVADGSFTISLWFYKISGMDNNSEATLIEKKPQSSGWDGREFGLHLQPAGTYSRSHEDNAFAFQFRGTDGNDHRVWVDSPAPFASGPYYHLLVEFDRGDDTLANDYEVEIRIDNVVRATERFDAPPVTSTGDIYHAAAYRNGSVNQRITMGVCETRIYDRLLTDREKDLLYRLGAPVEPTLSFEWVSEPFTGSATDPMLFHDSSWSPSWRLSIAEEDGSGGRQNNLYEASVPSTTSWTQIAADITGSSANNNYTERNETYYIYDQTSGGNQVWSGSSLTNLTQESTLDSNINDIGAWDENGTTYLFTEELPTSAPNGEQIGLWSASDPAGPFTREKTVLNLEDRRTNGGDPHVGKIDGTYYLALDNDGNHPRYGTALMKAPDIEGPWRFVDENIKNGPGGDLEFEIVNGNIHGFTEFSGGDRSGVAYWEGEVSHR